VDYVDHSSNERKKENENEDDDHPCGGDRQK